jgi:hypothetical protein
MTRYCLVTLTFIVLPGAALGETAYRAGYDIYVGGFRPSDIQADVRLGRDDYMVRVSLESRGVLGWFVEARSETEVTGDIEDGRIIPRRYQVATRWGRQERVTSLVFDRNGLVEQLDIQPLPDYEPVPKELQRAPDPISALLTISQAARASNAPTELRLTAFGGIRATELRVTCPEHESISLADGIDLPSRALRCRLDGERIAGPPPRYLGGLGFENLGTLWLVPHERAAVPVRAEVYSSLGAMIVHINRFESASPNAAR